MLPQYQPFKKCVIKNNARSSCNDLTTEYSPHLPCRHGILYSPPPPSNLSSNSFLEKKGSEKGGRRKGTLARENVIVEEHTLRKIHVLDAGGVVPNYHQCFHWIESSLSLPVFHTLRINGKPPLAHPHIFDWYSYLVSVFLLFRG